MAFQPLGEDRPLPPTLDADLCCMEDGWDKDSPSNTGSSAAAAAEGAAAAATCMLPREQHQLHQYQPGAAAAAAGAAARLPTPSERAQRRRSRPGPAIPSPQSSSSSPSAAGRSFIVSEPGPPIEERKDGLLKMIQAQHKFLPAGVNGRAGARARCHVVSPFVGERRGQFVAWEVRETDIARCLCVWIYCCVANIAPAADRMLPRPLFFEAAGSRFVFETCDEVGHHEKLTSTVRCLPTNALLLSKDPPPPHSSLHSKRTKKTPRPTHPSHPASS